MHNVWALASLWVGLALSATLLAIWFKISTALTEIVVGTAAQLVIGAVVGPTGLAAQNDEVVGCTSASLRRCTATRTRHNLEVDAMLDDAREHFEQHFKKISERAKKAEIALDTDIAMGHLVEQIGHRAELGGIDLIVLGRRGKSRFEKMLVGSTAEKVLRYAHWPSVS